MSRGTSDPDILLLQAREPGAEVLEHELRCFVARSGLAEESFTAINMADEPIGPERLADIDVVTVGGSGEYSLVESEHQWFSDLEETMRAVVERGVPMFASCFGLQALVRAMGGELATDSSREEVGTFEISVTDDGRHDPIFGQLPETFDAQLGHNDSVVELPQSFLRLAESERCPVQAVRLSGRPIYATQFHPELTAEDNIERYARYIDSYKGIDESYETAMERAREVHRPSPHAERLFGLFLKALADGQVEA